MIRAAALAMMLLLSGCTLRPLYGGGGDGAVATTLRSVDVAPIEGRAGWLVRTALEDRLGAKGEAARYRPEIELDDDLTGFGIRPATPVTRRRHAVRPPPHTPA